MIFSVMPEESIEFFTNNEHSDFEEVFRHFCIYVTNIEELSIILSAHPLPLSINRGLTDKTPQCWVTDPIGVRMEFHEYDTKSLLNKCVKVQNEN